MGRIRYFWKENGNNWACDTILKPAIRNGIIIGAGFFFCPVEGVGFKCLINDRNDVLVRATGQRIGEYDPVVREAYIREVPN